LKEVSGGRVRIVGADPENSRYSGGDGSPYYVESIGHFLNPETDPDVWPESYDTGVIDQFERVSDRESLAAVRELARADGLLAGPSSGTAVAAALRVARELGPSDLVVVLPDSGRSYLSTVFSDDWMRRRGFVEDLGDETPTVADVLARRNQDGESAGPPFITVDSTATVDRALVVAGLSPADPTPPLPGTRSAGDPGLDSLTGGSGRCCRAPFLVRCSEMARDSRTSVSHSPSARPVPRAEGCAVPWLKARAVAAASRDTAPSAVTCGKTSASVPAARAWSASATLITPGPNRATSRQLTEAVSAPGGGRRQAGRGD
jgi:hypothetical protein